MTTPDTRRVPSRWTIAGLALLVLAIAVHVWWRFTVHVAPPTYSPHDDLLFFTQARAIADGDWLGTWSNVTMLKGGLWPAAMAAEMMLGLPIFTSVTLLVVITAALWVLIGSSFRGGLVPALTSSSLLFISPVYFSVSGLRTLRDVFYGQLVVITLLSVLLMACALVVRMPRARRIALAVVGLLLGSGSFAAAWLTREERQWQELSLALTVVVVVIYALRRQPDRRRAAITTLAGTVVAALLGTGIVAGIVAAYEAQNEAKYGVALANDMVEGEFPHAYGLLKSLRPAGWEARAFVPLTTDQRAEAYEISPAFARLEKNLEVNNQWIQYGCTTDPIRVCDDFAGGWVTFALRDAAWDAGAKTAEEFQDYWGTVATEVKAACDAGEVACAADSGLLPPLEAVDWGWYALTTAKEVGAVGAGLTPSLLVFNVSPQSDEDVLADWARSYPAGNPAVHAVSNSVPFTVVVALFQLVVLVGIGWFIVALVRRRREPRSALLTFALLSLVAVGLSAASRCAFLALVHVTSFPGVGSTYSTATQDLLCLAGVMAWTGVLALRARPQEEAVPVVARNTVPSPANDSPPSSGVM